jgi:hypothetical protein
MTRLRPPVFAKYIALSARLNSWAALSSLARRVATPTLTVSWILPAATWNGLAAISRRNRSAVSRAEGMSVSIRATANSSPPNRPSRSICRTMPRSRTARARSTSSPAKWPCRSLISLKSSASIISTDSGRSYRCTRANSVSSDLRRQSRPPSVRNRGRKPSTRARPGRRGASRRSSPRPARQSAGTGVR